MIKVKQVKKWLKEQWLVLFAGLAATSFIVFLYTFKLGSLTGGLSGIESKYVNSGRFITEVFEAPTFLIHKLLTFFAVASPLDSLGSVRLPSVVFFMLSVVCFYLLVTRWYTTRVALLTTLLFVTSSWSLTIGRQALPTVMYFAWLPVLALLYWSISKGRHSVAVFLWAISFGLSLYVPGLLWFVSILAISQRKRLLGLVKMLPLWKTITAAVVLILCAAPYVMLLISSPGIAAATLGLPTTMQQVSNFPEQLYRLVTQLFIFSGANPVFRLGHLPYIDIASTALFLFGIYRLRYSNAQKMMVWSGLVIGGWVLGAGFGSINIAIFMPLIYIFIGGGLSFLLVQWFTVFPKNPIARSAGVGLVSLLVLLISVYHLDRYFIAWPLSPATQAVFSEKTVVK